MRKLKAASLVLDFDFYPRYNVDSHNIRSLADALAAGAELPPVIIDKKSKRVVDGFHRVRAHLQVFGDDAEICVIEKVYASDADMFLDAMKYNSSHGAKLDSCDRTHCLLIAERLSIPIDRVAGALHMPADKLSGLTVTRTARGTSGLVVPLKRTFRHMSGKKLTAKQVEANQRSSGMNQVFYVNQLIEMIEANLLEQDDTLIDRLRHLHGLLDTVLQAA